MNCFQKLLSSWWRTTVSDFLRLTERLWIAFKNYYLRDEGQQKMFIWISWTSCELLSKIIIFVMKDNHSYYHNFWGYVVNCFQKLLSSWWRTTWVAATLTNLLLWIAFKNYYLRDEGQLQTIIEDDPSCCELLSKIIIFVMKDNALAIPMRKFRVVNCFQKLLSSWWRTTNYN